MKRPSYIARPLCLVGLSLDVVLQLRSGFLAADKVHDERDDGEKYKQVN
jgi:hypothetical protein